MVMKYNLFSISNISKVHLSHKCWSLRVVQDDLLHLWPEFEIDYTPMFNIPYTYLPSDLKVTFEKSFLFLLLTK